MGKTSSLPGYQTPTGNFSISGGPSANYSKGQTTYKLNEAQQKAYDYAQNAFAEGISSINTFSPEAIQNLNDQVNAYKENALEELDELYTPILQKTRNDAARRFGNLDNTVYLQNLDKVEKQRTNAATKLAQNIVSMQNDLINEEIQNRYNYLNFLNNYQNQIMGNAINASNLATNAANLQNNFQLDRAAYGSAYGSTSSNIANYTGITNSIMQAVKLAGMLI